MNAPPDMATDLRKHMAICQELLAVAERENVALKGSVDAMPRDLVESKKNLLPRLEHSLQKLIEHRRNWLRLDPSERARRPEIPLLLRQNQDLIMKIIVLDRENEQALLRRGLLPARHLPPVNRQRPHYVAELYRRGSR